MKTILLGLSLFSLMTGVLLSPAYAARSSVTIAGAPAQFEEVATIDAVDMKEGKIVVGDVLYFITASTPVVLGNGQMSSAGALQKGTRIGFITTPAVKGHRPTITRIWVVPKDFVLPQND